MGRPPEEAEVREWRSILEADDTASLHNEHQRALCDSWLAQARVIEARRDDNSLDEVAVAAGGETETPPEGTK